MTDLLTLKRGTVHLWHISTDEAVRKMWLSRYAGLLSEDENQRRQRFVFAKDRDQFLITRALVRRTLSRYADLQPRAWRFQMNDFGKPEIDSSHKLAQLRFNLSHCQGMVLCGVALESDIGVDCEGVNRNVEIHQLAPKVFSPGERGFFSSMPSTRQRETFFRFWTLKESYIKARGLGMSLPLEDICFDITQEPVAVSFSSRIPDRPDAWQFFEPNLGDPFAAALAINLPCVEKLSVELFDAQDHLPDCA